MDTQKQKNDQAILEAKANIDIARMMNALDNIKTSTSNLGVYELEKMENHFKEAMRFITSMQEIKKLKDCVFNEAKIAKDIVDGIKSKSMYLEKIQELVTKLEISNNQYVNVVNENQRLKRLLVNFIERFDVGQEPIDIDFIKRELNVNVKPMREIQEAGWQLFISKLPQNCRIEEDPFRK